MEHITELFTNITEWDQGFKVILFGGLQSVVQEF